MSEENVELFHRAHDAFNRRDTDAFLALCDPRHGGHLGPPGAGRRRPLAGDVVVAVIAMHGRGKGSGAPFDLLPYFVYEVRDGSIVRDRAFTSKAEALEAAGLSE